MAIRASSGRSEPVWGRPELTVAVVAVVAVVADVAVVVVVGAVVVAVSPPEAEVSQVGAVGVSCEYCPLAARVAVGRLRNMDLRHCN